MHERDSNLVISSLSGQRTEDGVRIELNIIRLEHESDWSLEVVNDRGTSTVWEETFPTDDAAYAEFQRTLNEEGVTVFLDAAKVIPFPR